MNRRYHSRSVLVAVCGAVLLAAACLFNLREPGRVPVEPAESRFLSGSEADFDRLIELIQAESDESDGWTVIDNNDIDSIDSYEDELSLIIGGGQTVHEQPFLERWWYRLQGYLQNGFKSPDPLP